MTGVLLGTGAFGRVYLVSVAHCHHCHLEVAVEAAGGRVFNAPNGHLTASHLSSKVTDLAASSAALATAAAPITQGTWHHMTVAVKVLQHDSTTAAVISNEVDLVMSFRHPHIVAGARPDRHAVVPG